MSKRHKPGYATELFNEPSLKYVLCPVCRRVLNDPVGSQCGHLLCRACVDTSCPVCDKDWNYTAGLTLFAKRTVNKLQVKCAHACAWTGTMDQWTSHDQKCPKVSVACPDCQGAFLREVLGTHRPQCPERHEDCPQCGEPVSIKIMAEHERTTCGALPTACPVCREIVMRKELPHHQRIECLQATIDCPLCHEKMKRQEYPRHLSDNAKSHEQLAIILCNMKGSLHQEINQLQETLSGFTPLLVDTPVHRAVFKNWPVAVRALHRCDYNVFFTEERKRPTLSVAIIGGCHDVVATLLNLKADPNKLHRGCTPLHDAYMKRSLPMAKLLLEARADPNKPCEESEIRSTLQIAVAEDRQEWITLLRKGVV